DLTEPVAAAVSEPIVDQQAADSAAQARAAAPGAVRAMTPSKVVAQLVLIAIVLFSAVEAARLLEFAVIADILAEVLALAGHVLFGGVIITVGVLLGNFLAGLIDRSTNGADRFA